MHIDRRRQYRLMYLMRWLMNRRFVLFWFVRRRRSVMLLRRRSMMMFGMMVVPMVAGCMMMTWNVVRAVFRGVMRWMMVLGRVVCWMMMLRRMLRRMMVLGVVGRMMVFGRVIRYRLRLMVHCLSGRDVLGYGCVYLSTGAGVAGLRSCTVRLVSLRNMGRERFSRR